MRHVEAVVGRREELEVVERFVASVGEGVSGLTITGSAGIGKTTLWRAGVAMADDIGLRVLTARPSGAEASLSFAGLADLLEPVDGALLDGLPPPQRRALDVALLREDVADGRIDLRAVASATYAVLRELASERATLVAVDDAQWLDEATADTLRFALRRLGDATAGVLVSVRTGTAARPDTFEQALPEDRRVGLDLAPLTVAALHEVIRGRVGRSLSRPLVVKIVQRSGGNAFYALEMARELVRHGAERSGELPVPASVQEVVRARVDRLPGETREALLLASALAVPTTSVVPADQLEPAEDAAVVQIDESGRIRFEHPLVAAAIYGSAPAAARRRAHRTLASRTPEKEERARHLALAADGPDDAVAAALDDAATHTAARGASAAAAQLARFALELTPGGSLEARVRRSLALAHYLLDAGEAGAARAVLESCDPGWVEGDLRARLLRERGWILWYEGDHDAGYQLVREALVHARDAELAARTHAAAAWLLQDNDLERAIEHSQAAVDLLDPDASPGPYSFSLLHSAYLRLLNGEGSDEEAYLRGRELQERGGIDWDDTSPVVGMWPVLHDRFEDAQEIYERGLVRSRAEGDVTSVQGTLLRLAELACWTGRWSEADRLAAEGVDLAERTGSSAFLGSALYARGLVDAHLGRAEAARSAADRIVDEFGDTLQGGLGWWVRGFVALSVGDARGADDDYRRAAEIVDGLGQREPARFRFQPDHLEAVVALDDLDRARGMLAALEARAEVFPRPWILATAARCRALVLAAERDLDGALGATATALRRHERLEMPFERARTLLVRGVILRRLRQKRRAREALEEAEATFDRLGATLWSARARDELSRVAARRAPAGLTATELRIARLASAGLTNPEIAAQVFVSRKTVEANLGRVYRKLGITSRVQLAGVLQRDVDAIS